MATFISSLAVKLGLQSAQFNKGMDRSRQSTKRFQKQSDLASRSLKRFAGAMIAAVGARRMLAAVAGQYELVDSLAKVSDKLGVTTEALAGLRHAANLSGVASNTLDMAIQRMTRRLAEAAKGTGEAKAALYELGLNAKALTATSPDKAFGRIATAMSHVRNQSDKVRLSFKLFDSEGVALVNTLAMGEAGLRAAAEEAERYGLAISRIDAENIEKANDAVTRIGAAWTGVKRKLAIEFAGDIERFAEMFTGPKVDPWTEGMGKWEERLKAIQYRLARVIHQQRELEKAALAGGEALGEEWEKISKLRVELKLRAQEIRALLGGGVPTSEDAAAGRRVGLRLSKAWDDWQAKGLAVQKFVIDAYDKGMLAAGKTWWGFMRVRWEYLFGKQQATQEFMQRMRGIGEEYRRDVETPMERFERQMVKIEQLFRAGWIDLQTYTRQIAKLGEELIGPKKPALGGPTPALQIGTQAAYGALLRGRKSRMEELTDQLLIEAKKQSASAADSERHLEVIADEHLNN